MTLTRLQSLLLVGLLALTLGFPATRTEPARAQQQPRGQQPSPGATVGSLFATGSTWNFDGSITAGAGPWASLTVTNTTCSTPYQPGTAQAGAIIFTAQLTVT